MRQEILFALVAILAVAKFSQALTIYVPPQSNDNEGQNDGGEIFDGPPHVNGPSHGPEVIISEPPYKYEPQHDGAAPSGPVILLSPGYVAAQVPDVINAKPPQKPASQPNVASSRQA